MTQRTVGLVTTDTTVMAYNKANELTKRGAADLSYDAWGRLTRDNESGSGDYVNYAYAYGDKLTGVTTKKSGMANVTYEYGGDQKRRERSSGGTTTISICVHWCSSVDKNV